MHKSDIIRANDDQMRGQIMHKFSKTRSRLMSWFQSRKWVKVKVVKLCFKKWNGHILMHIYHKQCEIIQKIRWKSSNGQFHCFCKGNQLRSAKYLENWVRTTKNNKTTTKKTTTKQSKLGKSMWGQSHVIGPEGIGDISPLLPKRQKYQDLKYDV